MQAPAYVIFIVPGGSADCITLRQNVQLRGKKRLAQVTDGQSGDIVCEHVDGSSAWHIPCLQLGDSGQKATLVEARIVAKISVLTALMGKKQKKSAFISWLKMPPFRKED